jgi:hypothetical protein
LLFCVGSKLIGGPKLIWREQQKTNLVGMKNWLPNKNLFGGKDELAPQQVVDAH